MGVLAYMVPAQEVRGALGRFPTMETEGATWAWDFEDLLDADDVPIPQATIAAFAVDCKIFAPGGAVLVTPTFTATGDGSFHLEVDESLTIGLAGESPTHRVCSWAMSISDGTDVVQLWKTSDSPFAIYHADGN